MSDTFCAYLWRQYYMNPWQNQVCCLSETVKGDVFDKNTNDKKRIRLQMLKGERPPECKYCHDVEDKGGYSLRHENLRTSPVTYEMAKKATAADGSTRIEPDLIDIRPSSICNFACLMCIPSISSKWIKDKDIMEPFYGVDELKGVRLNVLEDDIWQQVPKKMIDMAKHNETIVVHMAGGEPLMDKKGVAVLDFLIATGISRKTTLILTTNGHFIDDEMIERFKKFADTVISVSLDGIWEVNDYIRHGSNFAKIEGVIKSMAMNGIRHRNAFSVSALSVFYYDQFYDWVLNKKDIHIQWVEIPRYMSVACLPQKLIDLIGEKYDGRPGHFQTIADFMKHSTNDPKMEADLKEFLRRNDEKRGVNHRKVFPEICEYLYA